MDDKAENVQKMIDDMNESLDVVLEPSFSNAAPKQENSTTDSTDTSTSPEEDHASSALPAPRQHAFATKVVHAGLVPDPTYGSVVPAIHQSSTYVQPAPGQHLEDYDYSRAANPTRRMLENALGELEGGYASAFSSGMAATHATITAVCKAGDHIIIPDDLYGGTYRLVDKILSTFGIAYTMVDQADLKAVRAATRENTRLIWVETPTNPTLKEVDVTAICDIAADNDYTLVAVDNTFATPANQLPLSMGADIVVHSTTKYLGGHSDTIGGAVIVSDEDLHSKVRFIQLSIGAVPGPLDCFLVHRGLRTLKLRMDAHQRSAQAVSEWLSNQPDVEDVRWPGYSGMVCFRHPHAVKIASNTQLFSLAESLGGVESLIEVPQAMTHQSVEDSDAAVAADLVRLSCGIEDPADLIEDLDQAFRASP